MLPSAAAQLAGWDALLAADPGRRNVAPLRAALAEVDAAGLHCLARAAASLAASSAGVAIVTGFAVAGPAGWTCETDGPPGALRLAALLHQTGRPVTVLTDQPCLAVLRAGAAAWHLPPDLVEEFPPASASPAQVDHWITGFLGRRGASLGHLISVERAGPSHTPQSLLAQRRKGPAPLAEFLAAVPPASRNVCHNMRGLPLDAETASLASLFERVLHQWPGIVTIGIGDGGNEIGLGSVPWEAAVRALGPVGGRIACRIPATHTLIAGVSNWAAAALARACGLLTGCPLWQSPRQEQELLEALVAAGAVDGVTGQPRPTVDGLEPAAYLDWLRALVPRP